MQFPSFPNVSFPPQCAANNGAVSKQGKRAALAGSTDEALLQRLGDVVQGMKDDFMVVHFRESCSYCRKYLSDEPRCRAPLQPCRPDFARIFTYIRLVAVVTTPIPSCVGG